MTDDLREQVRDAINDVFRDMNCRGLVPTRAASAHAADAVLAVFADAVARELGRPVSCNDYRGSYAYLEADVRDALKRLGGAA